MSRTLNPTEFMTEPKFLYIEFFGVIMHGMYTIRKAVPEDAEKVSQFLKTVGGESENLTFGCEGLPFEATLAYLKVAQCYFVAEAGDGRIIGTAELNKGRRRCAHRAELAIAVIREFWGEGASTGLFNELLIWAKANGVRKINLEVRADNERAKAFYKKCGFVHEGNDSRLFPSGNGFVDGEYWGLEID